MRELTPDNEARKPDESNGIYRGGCLIRLVRNVAASVSKWRIAVGRALAALRLEDCFPE